MDQLILHSSLLYNKRPGRLKADVFFFKCAMIIIGLCAKIGARKQN